MKAIMRGGEGGEKFKEDGPRQKGKERENVEEKYSDTPQNPEEISEKR